MLQDQFLSLTEQRKHLHSENTTLSGEVNMVVKGRVSKGGSCSRGLSYTLPWICVAFTCLGCDASPLQVESLQKLLNIARREASSANASLDVAHVSAVGGCVWFGVAG